MSVAIDHEAKCFEDFVVAVEHMTVATDHDCVEISIMSRWTGVGFLCILSMAMYIIR